MVPVAILLSAAGFGLLGLAVHNGHTWGPLFWIAMPCYGFGFGTAFSPLLTLAHDVSDGGLALALAEAESWSGRPADVRPAEAPYGAVLLACARENRERLEWDVSELGTVR